ncbi:MULTISPECIES: alpha/beta hydrolase [unclassified Nocardioides]|uniref:alpha/beta hydrolase n=1 Tax=unclassified Nocardioides TaxID=2615069 RepID=UPI0024071761|nr:MULTISPECIES: alpha/beta hydrolase [unclassified Nocardioides]MDF9716656.1 alpha/beta hydrolase [Nocardioides sp. ChNu-99]
MRPSDWLHVRLGRALAPLTVRYGEPLRFAGTDLPRPRRLRVPTRHGAVPVLVHRPPAAPATGAGAYVHLHGGAFLMRHVRMDDWWCRYVAATAEVVTVAVDFAVAPRATYPVAQEQCHDVAAWVAGEGAAVLGTDPTRVAVGGFSSGGGLAASVCLQARDLGSFAPALQVLGVPALDIAAEPAHRPGMISPELRALVRRVYFPDAARRVEPYASPLRATTLAGLPPAVVLTAERDTLREEGDRYAARLAAEGLLAWHDTTPGVDHYFLTEDPARARVTMARTAAEIARHCAA